VRRARTAWRRCGSASTRRALPPVDFGGGQSGAVGSRHFAERYGVTPSRLIYWQRSGWIEPTAPRRGSGSRLWWGPAAQRMVAFLAAEIERDKHHGGGSGGYTSRDGVGDQRRRLWRAIRLDPTAVWFVDVDAGPLRPAWSAELAVRLIRRANGEGCAFFAPPFPD
jgi:hypothetical protein